MRVEATAALAGKTADARLGAALAEDSGWMYALVLEDFDRAAQSFAAAIELDPGRRGALLGAGLVAARRGESAQLAASYEGLATSIQLAGSAPETAAALHLRAAAIAAANGDLELANQRVAAARAAAPDDTSALLVVAESSATPHVGGDDPQAAVDPLLARAEVLDLRSALADDPAARASWELDRAEALELAGRLREAGSVIAAVLRAQPDDLRALTALRRMTERAGDRATWARASYQLARVIGDRTAKLSLLRDAATVFDMPGATPEMIEASIATYRRLLVVDPGAPELERVLAIMRERADIRGLTAALTDRLTWLEAEQPANAQEQMVPLLLERATVLHGLGDYRAAAADLDALLERGSPNNIEALRFRADLALNAGDAPHAVELWRRCLAVEKRPQRRAEIELQLAGVLAENVNDLAGAIEQLTSVLAANPDDAQLHERVLGLATRAGDWPRATRALEELARLRGRRRRRRAKSSASASCSATSSATATPRARRSSARASSIQSTSTSCASCPSCSRGRRARRCWRRPRRAFAPRSPPRPRARRCTNASRRSRAGRAMSTRAGRRSSRSRPSARRPRISARCSCRAGRT